MERAADFIKAEFGPSVLVLSTPEADAMCGKCGLTCGQLLQPFSKVSVQDHTGRREVTVHFNELNDYKPISNPVAIRRTKAAVNHYRNLCQTWSLPVDDSFQTPWFDGYRAQFLKLLRPSEHETISHPLIHLIFCTIKCDHPITAIAASNSSKGVKELHAQFPFFDGAAPIACVLLTDADDDEEEVSATLESIRDNFGGNRVFHLNLSLGDECDEGIKDMWLKVLPYLSDTVGGGEEINYNDNNDDSNASIGDDPLSQMVQEAREKENKQTQLTQGLTPQHIRTLFRLVEDFASKALWPFINNTIHKLSEEIQAIKKSKSAFATARKWFGRSDTAASPTKKGENKFEDDLRERKFADLLFFAQSYQQASKYYNHVKRDNGSNSEKSFLHEAGAIEMMAICQALTVTDAQKVEWRQDLTKAIHIYKARCRRPIHTMRATFVLAELLKSRHAYVAAGHIYLQEISDEAHLRSALFFEQCALLFALDNSMSRKAMFQLVLAAFQFNKAGEYDQAFRCYRQLEEKFKENKWLHINHHVHLQMARNQQQLHNITACMHSLKSFLRSCPASEEAHQHALIEFAQNYKKKFSEGEEDPKDEFAELPLPLLDHSSISVQLQVQASTRNSATFEALEETAANFLGVPQVKQLAVMSDNTTNATRPVVVINEPIVIQFNITNPTSALLHLLNITLDCEMAPDEDTPVENELNGDHVELSTMDDVQLAPGREMNLILSVTPLKTGQLNVKGIKYAINASEGLILSGWQKFRVRGKRRNTSLQDRLGKIYEPDFRLNFNVAPPCPLLTAHIGPLPSVGIAGQILDVEVELKNVGKARVQDVVCVFPPCLKQPHIVGEEDIAGKRNFIDLKSVASLAPGEVKKLVIRMQITSASDVVDCWQLAYRGENPPSALPYRLLKMCREIRVVQGPEVVVWMNSLTATSAILNIRFLSRRVTVQPVVGELCSTSWELCDNQIVDLDNVGKIPTITTLHCKRLDGSSSAGEGANFDSKISSSSAFLSSSTDDLAQLSCNDFVKQEDGGFYLTWKAEVKNRKDFPIFGVCKMGISTGPAATAIFDPDSVFSTLSVTEGTGVQSVSPVLVGTGFQPNEPLEICVSQNFTSTINWLGKPVYILKADEGGNFEQTLTALLLTPYVVLDGVEIHREGDPQPIIVQRFILPQ
eukprot:m.66248 g.66248  ORF g.66248 m.66248 type:complete len:1166 (-) comp8185_c1_seq1:1268-4765(-)